MRAHTRELRAHIRKAEAGAKLAAGTTLRYAAPPHPRHAEAPLHHACRTMHHGATLAPAELLPALHRNTTRLRIALLDGQAAQQFSEQFPSGRRVCVGAAFGAYAFGLWTIRSCACDMGVHC